MLKALQRRCTHACIPLTCFCQALLHASGVVAGLIVGVDGCNCLFVYLTCYIVISSILGPRAIGPGRMFQGLVIFQINRHPVATKPWHQRMLHDV